LDVFLRENLDWLARSTNWAKFAATASLGLIYRGAPSAHRPAGVRGLARGVDAHDQRPPLMGVLVW